MIILALDASSTHIGYTVGDDDRYVHGWQRAYSGDFGPRLHRIAQELQAVVNRYDPDLIAVEYPVYVKRKRQGGGSDTGGAAAFCKQSKAIGVIEALAAGNKIRYLELSPTSVKVALAGSARAGKQQMIAAARLQFTGRRVGEHHADSIGVWLAAWNVVKLEKLASKSG